MHLPDFDYHAPDTLGGACALLASLGSEIRVLAGGTDLLHKMKVGKLAPRALMSLKRLDALRGIRYEKGRGVVIGALATQSDVVDSPVLHARYRSVSEAAHRMASLQIRNLGTVGGNIVNGVPSADLPPILIALGATIRLVHAGGERTLPLEGFFRGAAQTAITPGEILTEVVIPDGAFTGSCYLKFGLRRSGALAVAGAAVAVRVEDGVIHEARVALASCAPTVIRAPAAEEYLRGKPATPEVLEEAGLRAEADSRPRDSIRGSAEYRRNLARVLTKRALRKAVDEGHGASDRCPVTGEEDLRCNP
ncbi:MAG: xanthine dehydrogenase family protein subunit M [Deferrisomatales bacterium]|nr:xanthine dehydrogenase family protein subunit M [Deferrisomatales bacterium]